MGKHRSKDPVQNMKNHPGYKPRHQAVESDKPAGSDLPPRGKGIVDATKIIPIFKNRNQK